MEIADPCIVRSDDDVAEERDRGPEPDRVAVQPADHRLLQVEEAEHDPLRLDGDPIKYGYVVDRALEPVHVAAGAEGRAPRR